MSVLATIGIVIAVIIGGGAVIALIGIILAFFNDAMSR